MVAYQQKESIAPSVHSIYETGSGNYDAKFYVLTRWTKELVFLLSRNTLHTKTTEGNNSHTEDSYKRHEPLETSKL